MESLLCGTVSFCQFNTHCAYYAAVLISRITGLARPYVRLSVAYGLLKSKIKWLSKTTRNLS